MVALLNQGGTKHSVQLLQKIAERFGMSLVDFPGQTPGDEKDEKT